MKQKKRSAAILTIFAAPKMNRKGRIAIAAWLRKQADALVKDGLLYTPKRFTARYLYLSLLISIICSTYPLAAQEHFAVRLGAQVGPGTKTGVVEFLIGQSKSTITASRDGNGRIVQTFASGMERKLFTVGRVSFAASGQAGIVSNPDNVSGLAQGDTTVIVKAWRNLSFVIEGVGTNAPAQGGEWDGSARITAQWEF